MKKYKIIYADPPWRYARSKVQGAAEKHYPTMSIEELCALPVKEIADKDCILFLWATFPQLKEALQLIKAWGFTYKSVRFLYKGIIINHNKKPSQPTLKRRFFKKKAAFFHGPVWERSGADFILKRKGEFF